MINYKGTPLFGEDSNPRHTSEFFAIVGTAVFWLIFLIFSFVIKTEPKKKFKEVQIVLKSTPVVQKKQSASSAAQEAAASSVEKAVEENFIEEYKSAKKSAATANSVEQKPAQKNSEIQKTSTQQKKQTQTAPATTPKTQTSEPIQYAVDPMEAFAQQTKQQPKKVQDFDAMFADDFEEEDMNQNSVNKVSNNAPSYSGQAGTAASEDSAKVTSQSNSAGAKTQNASSNTTSSLEGIKNTTFTGNVQNGVESKTQADTQISGSGKVSMKMSNGRVRALISPAKPVINLSEKAASTIDANKKVVISFKVLQSGNVTEITITPEAILSSLVRKEIIEQLSKWQFEPADYAANATFEYKILKR